MKTLIGLETRLEVIKMAVLVNVLKSETEIEAKVSVTAKHRQMLDPMLYFFRIRPDYDLDIIAPDQTLLSMASKAPTGLAPVLNGARSELALVQGDANPERVIHRVDQAIGELNKQGVTATDLCIACFGLTFKPNTDELRESPALRIILMLAKCHPGRVRVVEPNLETLPENLADQQVALMDLDLAIRWANILVLLVDHAQFKNISQELSQAQRLIDTRGIWEKRYDVQD